jgi:hypothetical protein
MRRQRTAPEKPERLRDRLPAPNRGTWSAGLVAAYSALGFFLISPALATDSATEQRIAHIQSGLLPVVMRKLIGQLDSDYTFASACLARNV